MRVGRVQNEIKGKGPRLGPVVVFGANKPLSPKSECVVLLGGTMRDGVGFCPKGGRPKEAEVAKAATLEKETVLAELRCNKTKCRNAHIPTTATFFPGPIFARTRGLHEVIPAHSIGAANSLEMLSGI